MGIVSNTTTSVWVTTSFVGFHRWDDAHGDVWYLKQEHRHKFGVRVDMQINGDREIEYHQLCSKVEDIVHFKVYPPYLGTKSCETIAGIICDELSTIYEGHVIKVSVDEDGECGSIVTNRAVWW